MAERTFVVVSPEERSQRILRETGELAAGSSVELVVLTTLPDEEFERTRSTLASVNSSDVVYGINQAIESAIRRAKRIAREAFEGLDSDYRIVADIGPEADTTLETAHWEGCGHLFIAGRRRSPTGKLVSRSMTQSVMLSFDSPVTVLLGETSSDDAKGNEKGRSGLLAWKRSAKTEGR